MSACSRFIRAIAKARRRACAQLRVEPGRRRPSGTGHELRRNPLPEFARRHAGGTAERVAETRWRRKAERIRHRLDALVAQQHVLGMIDPRVRNVAADRTAAARSEEHTSELKSLMRLSYAVFCLTQ